MHPILTEIVSDQLKLDRGKFKVGDSVAVHTRVREGDKERVQIFNGIVIARRGSGINEMFTVRRVVGGEGIERVFPLHSPGIERIAVMRSSVVLRSSKMYYLRKRIGKAATKVKERRLFEKKLQGVT
jgi:large subunit ribosomal protein L19